ncbi:Chromosome transmission fidelity protein 8 homolog, partial [Geodia barretti]
VKSKSFGFRIIRVMVQLLLRLSNPGEWGLVELQGQLETRDGAPFDGMHMGDLHFDAQGTPSLIIGHHLLTGKVVELDKPLAVLAKRSSKDWGVANNDTMDHAGNQESGMIEYEIMALVRKKILFKNRPKPIITSTLPIKHT